MSTRTRIGLAGLLVLVALCVATSSAAAALQFTPGGVTLDLLNAAGEPETAAGAHPDRLLESYELELTGDPEQLRDMAIDLPAGLGGDPTAVPFCPRQVFGEFPFGDGGCPPESQVGNLIEAEGGKIPLYSVEPGPNEVAVFGATPFFTFRFVARLRPSDQGLTLRLTDLGQIFGQGLMNGQIELWGVPADHQAGTSIPRRPLLTMPTRCDAGPPAVTVSTHTWQRPEVWISGSGDTGAPLVGCDQLPFDPGIGFAVDNPVVDSPSGVTIDMTVPQDDDPEGLASSQIEDISVALPEGMTLSAGGAAGLTSCSDAQLGLGSAEEAGCPPSSRVGSVELAAPQFERTFDGAVYIGEQRPDDRFRLFVVASGMGSEAKIVGSLRADPVSGRLTAILNDLPQVSFERMTLRFDGGARGLLATPLACGPATTTAEFTPHSGTAPVTAQATVGVARQAGPCRGLEPFAPEFSGGSTSNRAGRATAFTTTVRRRDGEQLPTRLSIAFPPGMSAAVGAVPRCAAADANAGTCPAASRIGAIVAELGPGLKPAQVSGQAYLTGPYRRAPFGVALVFDAKLGPFDLGKLAVRGALRVDPLNGQVTVETDSLPTVFEGIPIRFRTIGLDIDRPGFMRNPTSCGASSVVASLRSTTGATTRVASPFFIRNCIDLPFRPRFSVALTERAEQERGGKPGLRLAARLRRGDANLRSAEIALPGAIRFDASAVRAICPREEALVGNCPRNTRVGSGYGRTPLLKRPLKGSIYVVQPRGGGTPDLWTRLEGEGLEVSLRAETAFEDGRVETTLSDLPDFPLSFFSMRLGAGKRGIFALRRGPCGRNGRALEAALVLEGHNRARRDARVAVATAKCGGDG